MGRLRLADRLERLEAGQYAERAVEDAALGDRVDVRAREHRRGVGAERAGSDGAPAVLTGSTHASSPAARISPRSHARASSCWGDQHVRVTPPPDRAPKRASVSTRERRRASEIAATEVEYIALTSPEKGS